VTEQALLLYEFCKEIKIRRKMHVSFKKVIDDASFEFIAS
jgi:hypothetical protein